MGNAASTKRPNVKNVMIKERSVKELSTDTNNDLQDNVTELPIAPAPAGPRIARQHSSNLRETFSHVDPLKYEVVNGVAVISLGDAGNEVASWGTKVKEHRLYPGSVLALNDAFTRAESDDSARAVLVKAEGFYWCNGFDLKWLRQQSSGYADILQQWAERLLARILKFPKPTIAAVNGHACAAGAMLMLCFDVIVMEYSPRPLDAEAKPWRPSVCMVPGVNIDLVYSPGMSELMATKLPTQMHTDFIVFGKKFTALELKNLGVVKDAVARDAVLDTAMTHAIALKPKARHTQTLQRIKATLYYKAISQLELVPENAPEFKPMGFVTENTESAAPATELQMRAESEARAQRQNGLKKLTSIVHEAREQRQVV